MLLACIGLGACADDDGGDDGTTGAISFNMEWPEDLDDRPQTLMSAVDCNALGIATIVCNAYNGAESAANLLKGATWQCAAHAGTLTGVPAGSDRRVVVTARDGSGKSIYKGERAGLTVTAGQTVPAGTVTMTAISEDGPFGPTYTNTMGMDFVWISSGTFMMGSPTTESDSQSDETQHQVTLTRGYYMQTTEVTQGQYEAVMGANPSYFDTCGDDCPVEGVSWDDAQAFINELNRREGANNYSLPTEAQWEYACRAGTTTPVAFGNCLSTGQANYDGTCPLVGCSAGIFRGKTMATASLGKNAWGLYDMHGNVFEWCADWYGTYPSSSLTDPEGPTSGSERVFRGGSWSNYALYSRSACRGATVPEGHDNRFGFRLVLLPVQ